MDFGAAAVASQQNGTLNFFAGGATAAEMSAAFLKMQRLNAAGAQVVAANVKTKGKSRVADVSGNHQAATATTATDQLLHRPQHQLASDGSHGMLEMAQNSTRTAKNGREQQRAQKISDAIDQLKATLDKANFSDGSSSKLHVLMSCEGYVRSLKDKIKCYEMEAKLREVARGHRQQPPPPDNAITTTDDVKNWPAKSETATGQGGGGRGGQTASTIAPSGTSCSGGTDRMDTDDFCSSSGSGGDNNGSAASATSSRRRLRSHNKKNSLYSAASFSSSDDDENSLGCGRGSSSSIGSDGDAGSSDSGGGSASLGTTDSTSQGFTTDTASRDFTTDGSLSGYTGSLGRGEAGSADGQSDESEESTAGSRMRVVNYFDIFRLSNVPMAIADKSGALVDVNDAMRGFGRLNHDTVKTLTVSSLVAPESSKALQDAMSTMLGAAASSPPHDPLAPAQMFLANAGIGNRPTLLTVSLVYDEGGEASAFHVALIPRSADAGGGGDTGGFAAHHERNSTEYDAGAPAFSLNNKELAAEKDEGCLAGKRGPARTWDVGGPIKSQRRRVAEPGEAAKPSSRGRFAAVYR